MNEGRQAKHGTKNRILIGVAAITAMLGTGGCDPGVESLVKSGEATGSLTVDGSTTVFPIAQSMAEDFHTRSPDCSIAVDKSGTGSGFQKFERGEIDIAAASRPIESGEDAELKAKGIPYIEIPIAYDGVSVVVSPQNSWVDKLTTAELRAAWNSASTVKLWSDIRPTFPKEKITFYGPTDNHGTYEYFTEAIDLKKNDIRADCQKNQEYNAIIQAVGGDKDGIAYVGFNYYDQNRDKVKIVPIDSGNGPIVPSETTIANGTYCPLSRPLFFYVSKQAYDAKPQVKRFVQFSLSPKGDQDVAESSYVVLPKDLHNAVEKHVQNEGTGTLFINVKPGTKLADLYRAVSRK